MIGSLNVLATLYAIVGAAALVVAAHILLSPGAPTALAQPLAVDHEVAAELVRLINAERQGWGLEPLEMVEALDAAAHARLAEIRDHFSHDRPGGTLVDLLDEVGISWATVGENLAMVSQASPADAAARAHHRLMTNAAHRNNVMSTSYRYVGVGVTVRNGRWYFVELFVG